MGLDEQVKKAYNESAEGIRRGDTPSEVDEIRRYIRSAKVIIVPNRNTEKITVINDVLKRYGLGCAKHLQCNTNCCDLTRTPAITKALMALDSTQCDLVIARGRLGAPGSGSMLVVVDNKGRVLTAGISSSHVLHKKTIAEAVRDELKMALERVGFQPGK